MSNEKDFIKRPWGYYQIILRDEGYIIKKIVILPFQSISYQLHNHRSEHWVVVSGVASIIKGKKKILLNTGESIFTPLGVKHKISNDTETNLEIIEIQQGEKISEEVNEKL